MDSATTSANEPAQASDVLRAWHAVRGDHSIQYAPVPPVQAPPPPDWLRQVIEALRALLEPLGRWLGLSWPVIEKLLIACALFAVLALALRLLVPLLRRLRRCAPAAPSGWTPDDTETLALLADADRLAAEGRFDEATHLLLIRGIGQIRAAHPDWLEPSSTARDIARLPGLSEPARTAFTAIADRVERALFALRRLDGTDWRAAREAYARFALQPLAPAA